MKAVIYIAGLLFVIACAATGQMIVTPRTTIQGADYVGQETCAFCHEDIVQDFGHTAHGRIQLSGVNERVKGQGCEACHGPGSLHVEAGGGRGTFILNPGEDPEPCFECHMAVKAQFTLQYRHPVRKNRMSCLNCHNPHGQDIYTAEGMYVSRSNEVCMQCHREQARPRVFEHEALRDGCTTCHQAHGSINDKMLLQEDNNLCLKCHAQLAAPGMVTIGDFSHSTRVAQGSCWSAGCHTAVHGSDVNAHLRY